MGLIYNPSESEELVSNFNANIATCEQMISDLKNENEHLVGALNSKQLSGAAFTAGQGLFTQLVIPAVKKSDTAIQELKAKLQQYSQYTRDAGGEILDEDKLNEQLEALRRQQALITSQIRLYQNQARVSETPELTAMCYSYASTLTNFINTVQEDIRRVEEKLKKLHELDMKIAPLFNGISNEFSIISDGILTINNVSFDKTGKFVIKASGKNFDRIKAFVKDIYNRTKDESLNTILEETIQDGVKKNTDVAVKIAVENVWKNRYTTEIASGKIMGKVSGATVGAMKDAEVLALKSGKSLGRCVSGVFSVVGGVMDGFSDYQQDKNVGKAIAHGVLSTGGALFVAGVASAIPGPGWAIASGIIGGVAVGKLIDVAFDQKGVKDFFKNSEKNIGKAVSGFFGSVSKALT